MKVLACALRAFALTSCLALSGCVFGYYALAPADYHGAFVLSADASIGECDIGPGLWTTEVMSTCIYVGGCQCSTPTIAPRGTRIRVLHRFTGDHEDVTLRVGEGSTSRVVIRSNGTD
jgi:hypothetical protein